jgi:hypothetical protein
MLDEYEIRRILEYSKEKDSLVILLPAKALL